MVITKLTGGLGNQIYQYSLGRYLSCKLDTELKFDKTWFNTSPEFIKRSHAVYELPAFNVVENFATLEEIKHVKENGLILKYSAPSEALTTLSKLKNDFQGDIFIDRFVGGERYFITIIDILRKEFTLKEPLSPVAEAWKQKILSAECSVSMHFRYGDYAYHPGLDKNGTRPWFNVTPLSYCYTSVEILKHIYSNFTLFVFSDNLPAIKKSLHLDIPTEFIEGCKSTCEELILMSLCQNNITPGSSFSKVASMLNPNPNKRVLHPNYTTAEKAQEYIQSLRKNHLIIKSNFPVIDSGECISVPCNFYEKK